MPPWQIAGERGSIILERDKQCWHARYVLEGELSDIGLQQGVSAMNRDYGNGEIINWHEKEFDITTFEKIDYYSKCYDYFALDMEPFVPICDTLEIMRVFELCRTVTGFV